MSQSPKALHTRHYVVMESGLEVAFLALDPAHRLSDPCVSIPQSRENDNSP